MAGKKKRGAGGDAHDAPAVPSPCAPSSPDPPAEAASHTGWLYTRCPQCKTTYRISVAQLRSGRGEAECQACQIRFDALRALAENPTRIAEDAAAMAYPSLLGKLDAVAPCASGSGPVFSAADLAEDGTCRGDAQKTPIRTLWGIGVLVSVALLAAQLSWFEGPRLAQDEALRPWLDTACQSLGCRLPAFRDLRHIQIIDHALHPAPDNIDGYEFSVILANHAALPQVFPAIKLVLTGGNGSPVATRVFQPAEYLQGQDAALMAIGELKEIRLLLAKPQHEVGGFSFELL